MGLVNCCGVRYLDYPSAENKFEKDIREWEEELGAFKTTFNCLTKRSKFNQKLIHPLVAEKFFEKEFNKDMVKLIQQPFFKKKGLYDSTKLKALLFLFSRAEPLMSGRITYFDKSIYIMQEVLTNEEDNLNSPIEQSNEKLREFCELLSQVSIEGVTLYYMNKTKILDKYFSEIVADEVLSSSLVSDLFKKPGLSKSGCFNFQDISNMIASNQWFLTPGYFREYSYNRRSK